MAKPTVAWFKRMFDNEFKKGDLVAVNAPFHGKDIIDICVVASITIPCIYKVNEFFMVYSIKNKQKYITVRKFMKKIG